MKMNKNTVLVLGATGGIGGAIAANLAARGWTVRALARDPGKAAAGWRAPQSPLRWVAGDAMVRDDVVRAADASGGSQDEYGVLVHLHLRSLGWMCPHCGAKRAQQELPRFLQLLVKT